MSSFENEILGVDFGNVIIDHVGFGTTPEFFVSGDYNSIPPVEGAFESLRLLNKEKFKGNIFVLFKATDVADHKIMSWIDHNKFCEYTGILKKRIIRNENGRDKSKMCLEFGVTHFIDDRLEVLGFLTGKVKNLYLFRPNNEEAAKFKETASQVHEVNDWYSLVDKIL